MTKKKDCFTTNEKGIIKWYTCGPTVYDVAHLGHARTFLMFDIIRRILEDYFNYQVIYVMNITDIDELEDRLAATDYIKYEQYQIENNTLVEATL